ncbi:MAG: PDDEXK nuclease domain-containing protein [Opitutaceae bacterium]|jgi:predicted nuclease of restriction endonuclease-like (RecB) superfamily|nr:PDDEXK nuclease domain-containing protein [Opitutaceae bacterium]
MTGKKRNSTTKTPSGASRPAILPRAWTSPSRPARLPGLAADIRQLIDTAREQTAATVNATLTTLHWQIGARIRADVLKGKRADYGEEIIRTLADELECDYGHGFGEKNLRHMLQFAEAFPEEQIVSALRRQLTWSHFKSLIYIADPLKREFYAELCRVERWSTRALQRKINSLLFERTAISKKPEKTIARDLRLLREEDRLTPDLALRDPYILDFLGLADCWSEKDLESAILVEMQRFIAELGGDFAFLARQKRLTIDKRDYALDLLFYHRRLRRLVAIELKIGEFEAAHAGQMELYLRWLEKHERIAGEEPPVGIILCAGKNDEHVELLQLRKNNIHVADYLTALPPPEVLKTRLRQSIILARERLHREAGSLIPKTSRK